MNYQLLLLSNPSTHNFSKGLSSFVSISKQKFAGLVQQTNCVLSCPELIVMQADATSVDKDLELLACIKANPLFKHAPVLVFTLNGTAYETMRYFEYGATTCMLTPAAPQEWVNIINCIPAYWQTAA